MAATGPDFISLQARDLDASQAFYERYLGLVRSCGRTSARRRLRDEADRVRTPRRRPRHRSRLRRPARHRRRDLVPRDRRPSHPRRSRRRRPPHRLRADRRPLRPDVHLRRPRRLPGHSPRPRLKCSQAFFAPLAETAAPIAAARAAHFGHPAKALPRTPLQRHVCGRSQKTRCKGAGQRRRSSRYISCNATGGAPKELRPCAERIAQPLAAMSARTAAMVRTGTPVPPFEV